MKFIFLIVGLLLFFVNKVKSQTISNWKEAVVTDGKLDDWDEKGFKYDESTWLWYNIANDERYIYLAVRKSKHASKIYSWGGLMFTLNRKGKEQRSDEPWVTFPRAVDGARKVPENEWSVIEVGNFDNIKETKLNIYNEYGIQVGWTKFRAEGDLENTFCYELAIPIDLINLKGEKELDFNILLRGSREMSQEKSGGNIPRATMEHVRQIPNLSKKEMEIMVRDLNDMDWTEFWGKYRLAEKP